ncbi:MAG: hypothetical protein UX09_C0005G0021 [Candidatus Uhrbacteria bacterium GW2011_GWE2_45_35]|uniref:Uncharacterized protein n=1 Tax=Candidatus Uhrbacteria bacterium GW2011_GWE2_45_35 TaxID=1618993 RepID=A0A0G1QK68_9BACT|nr:MAG: hypothetical protein UX09_C0005G0021 [Candidatus Uhrbacteria bacterium GW2011_GWE2_45_35]
MPKKQTLTVGELKSLLLVNLGMVQIKQAKLQEQIHREIGYEAQAEKPEFVSIKNKLLDQICDTLARRLKRNRHTTPLLSVRDIDRFTSYAIGELMKIEDIVLEAEEHEILEKYMRASFGNIIDSVYEMVPKDQNPYEEYWRWVTTVLTLSAERSISPTELLVIESETDEITRRMFTREQFIDLFKRAVEKFVNVDALKKNYLQPLLDALTADMSDEDRCEFEQEFEGGVMRQMREAVEKAKPIIDAFLSEEVERIYVVL